MEKTYKYDVMNTHYNNCMDFFTVNNCKELRCGFPFLPWYQGISYQAYMRSLYKPMLLNNKNIVKFIFYCF
jgi:hypothetical protein